MNPNRNILRLSSILFLPAIIISIFLTLRNPLQHLFIQYWFTCILSLGIILFYISWELWGGFIVLILNIIIITYAWMKTGVDIFPIQIIPPILITFVLYKGEQRINTSITHLDLSVYDKERSYNTLSEQYSQQKALRESYYKKAKRFSRLSYIAKELGFILTPEELSKNIIFHIRRTIENGNIYLLYGISTDLRHLEVEAVESLDNNLPSKINTLDEFNTWVLQNRQPLIVTDLAKDFRFNSHNIPPEFKTRSIIATPLITGNRLLGIIRIDSYTPNFFTLDDLRLLTIISNICALTKYNAQLYKQTEYLATRDDLTGLFVKRYFLENLEKLIVGSQIQEKIFSVLLLDLDNFKNINDEFGHSVGDKVLQRVALLLEDGSSPTGIVSRYGGEEFAIILPNKSIDEATITATNIKDLIQKQQMTVRREIIKTTTSIGIAEFPKDGNTSNKLIEKADKCLYEAKKKGKNKVIS